MKENILYTSVEQSKKLMELGFSTDVCDMYYWCGTDIRFGGYKAWDEEADIPSWSLDLLMRILLCYDDGCKFYISAASNHSWKVNIWYYDDGWKAHEEVDISLLNAVFNAIVWLTENGYINCDIKY